MLSERSGVTLRETRNAEWSRVVPAVGQGNRAMPLLGGTIMKVAPRLIGRWVRQLLDTAAAEGADVEPFDRAVNAWWLDPLRLFETAFSDTAEGFHEAGGLVRALSPLTVMPVLHACRRAWASPCLRASR